MTPNGGRIAELERRYADAWEAHNRAELAAILRPDDSVATDEARDRARAAIETARSALEALDPAGPAVEAKAGDGPARAIADDDRGAFALMRRTLELLASGDPLLTLAVDDRTSVADDRPAEAVLRADGLSGLLLRTMAAYTRAAEAIEVDGETLDRLDVLSRLAIEPDAAARRRLFLALEPLWRAVDGDGGPRSPYRVALRASAEAWRRDGSPVDANAIALGIDPADVEPWLRAILDAWREVAVDEPVEPWDERFSTGAIGRVFDREVTLDELRRVNDAFYASLGADPTVLGIRYDIAPRTGRGPVPVAFMLDVDIPRRTRRGWTPGEQWVLASYARPRPTDLGELLHETGHAIHFRAIRTRPAFAVLPESMTTLTEALGDLAAWDLYEPAWQRRWLGRAASLGAGLRARYGDVVRDVAWSLFEIELHQRPDRPPNEVWTGIAERYLGVLPHPEWSWWAIRGQLVQSPGYMVNYGLGAIVTADLRARLREFRGDWTGGDPGWYEAVSDAIYRWGAEREPREIVERFLGRPVAPDAILADLRRLRGAST